MPEKLAEPVERERRCIVPALAAAFEEPPRQLLFVFLLPKLHDAGIWLCCSQAMPRGLEELALSRVEDHLDARPGGRIPPRGIRCHRSVRQGRRSGFCRHGRWIYKKCTMRCGVLNTTPWRAVPAVSRDATMGSCRKMRPSHGKARREIFAARAPFPSIAQSLREGMPPDPAYAVLGSLADTV
ncbi:MAG TPA: hypothetical protein VF516_33130 [Kofleriaceae bacterium]